MCGTVAWLQESVEMMSNSTLPLGFLHSYNRLLHSLLRSVFTFLYLGSVNSAGSFKKRIDANRDFRLHESIDGQVLADRPHQFREHPEDEEKIIIPSVSSENREYIPIGYLDEKTIYLMLLLPCTMPQHGYLEFSQASYIWYG